MGSGSEWNAGFPTLPRLNLESEEKTNNKIPCLFLLVSLSVFVTLS